MYTLLLCHRLHASLDPLIVSTLFGHANEEGT